MAKNILNMILWHPKMEIGNCKITYLHRGARGNIKTILGNRIRKVEKGFLILDDETMIPLHRVIRIQYKDDIVWNK
ncbi:MAG: DUF504 domain-containing protein [Methanomicrobiales archaeon]